jgi:hypothetical protein
VKAHAAIGKLIAHPDQAVEFLKPQLARFAATDFSRVAKLLPDLDSDEFETRERATAALQQIGAGIIPLLREALVKNPPQEARRRITELLEELASEERGYLRAIEALEHLRTQDARDLLEMLSRGHQEHTLTREAKAALKRLQ